LEELDLRQIHQIWTDLREARVKDGFIFRVSRYFIDHWLRLLGAKAAWAVVDLQQRCYLAKSEHCQVSLKDLCAVTGIKSTTTMQQLVDEPLMRWFFVKRNTRQRRRGKVMRGKNRYDLQMSDPLTPQHQGQIAQLLLMRLRDGSAPKVRGPEDLIRLVSDLPSLAVLPSDDAPDWATCEPLNLRQIALRALAQSGQGQVPARLTDEPALRRAFADAQARITQPARIALATHYFRTEWVSHLGAINAWLVMILRSRCYWNKDSGEVRDDCVMSNRQLSELLGVSARSVIRSLQDPLVQKFVAAQSRVYEPRPSDGRRTPSSTRFQVLLTMEPLTPPDEQVFAEILLSDAARYGLDRTTGQMNMLDILDLMSQMTSDEITLPGPSTTRLESQERRIEESSAKTEIRRPPTTAASAGSSDKNTTREPGKTAIVALETSTRDPYPIQDVAVQTVVPLFEGKNRAYEARSGDKNETRTNLTARIEIRETESDDNTGTMITESGDNTEKQYSNTQENTVGLERQRQQQYTTVAVDPPPNLLLRELLIRHGIEEPALAAIISQPAVTPQLVQAWLLYAEAQPTLKNKVGFVVKRLLQNPPDVPANPDWLLVAGLSQTMLEGFAQRHSLEKQLGATVHFDDEQREAKYQAWRRLFGERRSVTHDSAIGTQTTVEPDRGRTARWQPDVG